MRLSPYFYQIRVSFTIGYLIEKIVGWTYLWIRLPSSVILTAPSFTQRTVVMFPKPVIVVSKCLGFDACRYNGQTIYDSFVDSLKEHVDFIPVCPEMEIGLGVPRQPIRMAMVKVGDSGKGR